MKVNILDAFLGFVILLITGLFVFYVYITVDTKLFKADGLLLKRNPPNRKCFCHTGKQRRKGCCRRGSCRTAGGDERSETGDRRPAHGERRSSFVASASLLNWLLGEVGGLAQLVQ